MDKDFFSPLDAFERKPFRKHYKKDMAQKKAEHIHVYGKENNIICGTDTKGHETPDGRDPLELVVHAPGGRIPLWDQDVTLRWRFQAQSLAVFRDPDEVKEYVRVLLGLGIQLWGDGVPVKFTEVEDNWDFEVVVSPFTDCDDNGCVLASAFFPDAGRHELRLLPTMFQQSAQEQVETMAHELGHIFGLRHFFALVSETILPAETFGTHSKFSIMNYGADSFMTDNDRNDLKSLYEQVWSNGLEEINGTDIVLVRPFSEGIGRSFPFDLAALRAIAARS